MEQTQASQEEDWKGEEMITDDLIEYYSNVKDDEFTMSQITRKLALELKSTRSKLEIARSTLELITQNHIGIDSIVTKHMVKAALKRIK